MRGKREGKGPPIRYWCRIYEVSAGGHVALPLGSRGQACSRLERSRLIFHRSGLAPDRRSARPRSRGPCLDREHVETATFSISAARYEWPITGVERKGAKVLRMPSVSYIYIGIYSLEVYMIREIRCLIFEWNGRRKSNFLRWKKLLLEIVLIFSVKFLFWTMNVCVFWFFKKHLCWVES